jgi:hypothetical protein
MGKERTYTITITYEASITIYTVSGEEETTAEDIESALWVGDYEIGKLGHGDNATSIRGDAINYAVEEDD